MAEENKKPVDPAEQPEQPQKRGRGRPKGSKNKPKPKVVNGRWVSGYGPGRPKKGEVRQPLPKKESAPKYKNTDERQAVMAAGLMLKSDELKEKAMTSKSYANTLAEKEKMNDPSEMADYNTHILQVAFLPKIDPRNPQEVTERFTDYAQMCIANGKRMTVEECALALRIDRETLKRYGTGKRKLPTDLQEVYTWIYTTLNAATVSYMVAGKTPQVTAIFYGRNNFGYTNIDEPDYSGSTDSGQKSTEEIAEKYKNLPD